MSDGFKIATTLGGLTLLSALSTPIVDPDDDPAICAGEIDLADATQRGIGSPTNSWHWNVLTSAQRAVLRALCPGKSANVFICTPNEAGVFTNYSVVMIWPRKVQADSGGATETDFTLLFRSMIVQP